MRRKSWSCLLVPLAAAAQLAVAADTPPSHAASPGRVVMVQAAPGVWHFHPSSEHSNFAWLLGAEVIEPSRWLAGFSYFNNSFDQKCQYLYGGRWWPISKSDPNWYFKLTGGVILGYKEPYEDKIPFNHNGVAPGIIPGLGYKMNRWNVQLNLVGPGLMMTLGYDLVR